MNMEKSFHFKIVLLGAFIILLTLQMCETKHIRKSTKKVKKEEIPVQLSVDGNKFTSVGCFRDAWNRVIPALEGEHQLLMEPNYKARKFALLKCARAAMDKHLKVFGIENGGQCFGAEDERSLNKYGTAVECRRDGKGGPWSLQAYKFTTLPINGGFSPWSRWTTCSKTCDHGVRRRMRTCSNPPPSNGGKDCSGLGPSVEGEICKDKECPTVLIDEAESGNTARPSRLSTTPSAPTAEQSGQSDKPKPSTSENKPPVIKEGSLIVLPKAAENRQGSDSQPDTQASKEDPHKDSSSVPNEKPREPSVDTPKMQSETMPIPKEGSDNGQRIEKGKATDSKMQEGDSAKPSSAQSDSVGFGPQEASHHVHPAGSEPFQFIDEPEDQRNPYVVPSMHQSESLKSHEQLSLPENPQDIDPSVAQETYNGEPAVSGNAVQLNTPMGPMAEMNHMNRNFNPSEPQQTEQSPSHSEECFCPKKVCDAKADIAFLVDGSSDIPQVYFTHVLDFMKALTRGFSSKDTQVNLVAYGDDAASAFNNFSPVQNLHEIDDSIDSMTYMGGDPRTGNALTKVQNGLFKTFGRTDAKHALILLTSGSSSDDTIQAAEDLRKSGIKLTTIGLGKLANVKELIDISSEPKSSHVFTAFLDTLPDIMDDIVKGVCSDIDGKLYNKDKQCICGANKVKNSKDKSTDVLSELGKSKEGKEEPPNGPREGSDDKTLQNKTRTDAKSSNNGDENAVPSGDGGKDNGGHKVDHKGENNGEAIGSTTHVSPQSSEPNRETVKIDSKDERKENSSTAVENKEQNKQTGQSLQERPSQPNREGSGSSPKENPKTDMSERIKTDEKVDLPEPQGTRNEKAVPKKDSNADNSININNQGPSGEQNGPIEIPAALEQIKTSNENMKTQSEPPETDSGTPQITILDNGYSKLMKSREQSSRGRQNNPGDSNPQGGVARPSEDNRPTQEPTPNRIESKESKPQEKVMEATESSFPPKVKPSEKQQQQESQGKPSEDSKDKTTSSQVEIPNPTSKTPPKQEEKSRANEQEQKGKDSEQHPPQMTRHPDGTFMAGQAEGSRISGIKETIVSKGCSVNLGVVLDSKTTAYGEDDNAKKLLFFAKKLTHMFPVSPEGNRVGMMVYSGSPKLKVVHFDHSLDPNTMDKAIDSASYLNMEIKTGKVLNFAQEHLFSRIPSGKQNVLLLITDGVSYDDVTSPANELKRRGVEIFVVGVGEGVIGKELEAIASEPASDHVVKTSYDFKQSLLEDIKQRICSSASKKGDDAYLPRRRGRLYRVLTEIERRRK